MGSEPGGVKRQLTQRLSGSGKDRTALAVELGEANAPPSEFRVFKAGENPSEKGLFVFNERSALLVMAEYDAHNKTLGFDFNHGTLLEGVDPEVSKSAGSFVPEVRDGELWATKCRWTDYAANKLTAREYRDFSPFFNHDDQGVVTRLINIALTNLPALDGIAPLVAANANPNKDDDMTCEACSALTARLTAADARLSTMEEECKALKAKLSIFESKDEEEKTKATALSALTGKATHAETLGVISGWREKAIGYDTLAAESATREATALRGEMDGVLKEGVDTFKIPPANKGAIETSALALGAGKPTKEGIAFLKALIAGMPKLVSGDSAGHPPEGAVLLSETDKHYARLSGITEEQALKAKKAIAEQEVARRTR